MTSTGSTERAIDRRQQGSRQRLRLSVVGRIAPTGSPTRRCLRRGRCCGRRTSRTARPQATDRTQRPRAAAWSRILGDSAWTRKRSAATTATTAMAISTSPLFAAEAAAALAPSSMRLFRLVPRCKQRTPAHITAVPAANANPSLSARENAAWACVVIAATAAAARAIRRRRRGELHGHRYVNTTPADAKATLARRSNSRPPSSRPVSSENQTSGDTST